MQDKIKSFKNIGIKSGIRFDGQGHNWLIVNNHLSLGFCYMSFLIKNSIE